MSILSEYPISGHLGSWEDIPSIKCAIWDQEVPLLHFSLHRDVQRIPQLEEKTVLLKWSRRLFGQSQ